jgi:putative transposase
MARPYSMDLRKRAIARVLSGESRHQVARVLKVAPSSVIKWMSRQARHGSAAPGQMGGHRRPTIFGEHRRAVLEKVAQKPHVTLDELVALLAERGVCVHRASVGRFLKREGKSYKKNPASGRAEWSEAKATPPALEAASAAD